MNAATTALALLALHAGVAGNLGTPDAALDGGRPALGHYNLKDGLALQGYDPVSYADGKPARGSAKIVQAHRGVTYRFASEESRERFCAEPGKYEPAYGGWCAYAMADGTKYKVDPESYLIQDGRLLLFYKGFLNNTRKKWQKQGPEEMGAKADGHWLEITSERAATRAAHANAKDGLALAGFDPVGYRDGEVRAGKPAITTKVDGLVYRFATKDARHAFVEDPEAFEPGYGGWCATAMTKGERVDVDPKVFLRGEGGLLLFHDAEARDAWTAMGAEAAGQADAQWARLTAPKEE